MVPQMVECVSKDNPAKGAMCLSLLVPPPPAPTFSPTPGTFLEQYSAWQSEEGPAPGDAVPRLHVCH